MKIDSRPFADIVSRWLSDDRMEAVQLAAQLCSPQKLTVGSRIPIAQSIPSLNANCRILLNPEHAGQELPVLHLVASEQYRGFNCDDAATSFASIDGVIATSSFNTKGDDLLLKTARCSRRAMLFFPKSNARYFQWLMCFE
jgi:hypothetical protein